ncbi:MAG: general secretion pathway protein G [Phycisphaerales bacterium]|jgi:general secretion pathway protein G
MQIKSNRGKGFTLVEILIVVVILGILAAIVVPQFAGAANEARTGNVVTQTNTIETQLELWAARNNGVYPDLVATGWGAVGVVAVPETMIGGGYLKAPPVNPHSSTLVASDVAATAMLDKAAADAAAEALELAPNGWIYDQASGQIRAAGANYIPRNNTGIGDKG